MYYGAFNKCKGQYGRSLSGVRFCDRVGTIRRNDALDIGPMYPSGSLAAIDSSGYDTNCILDCQFSGTHNILRTTEAVVDYYTAMKITVIPGRQYWTVFERDVSKFD